ncbi:MAG: hypothetical protein ACM3N5_07305 [Candidatus Eiseniibacteriota bacterium]
MNAKSKTLWLSGAGAAVLAVAAQALPIHPQATPVTAEALAREARVLICHGSDNLSRDSRILVAASQLAARFAEQPAAALRAEADARRQAAVACIERATERHAQVASSDAGAVQLADAALGRADIEDNLDLFEKLGLMEGHLMIGKALLDAGMQRDALPHFGHPVRELYDYLKPVLAERHYPDFEKDLHDLEQRATNAPKDPATTTAYVAVIAKIDGFRRTIPAAALDSPDFMTQAIALMVDDAAGDLGESLDRGRIVNTVEYHDAMGFARYADAAVDRYAKVLGARAAALKHETQYTLSAFPSLAPPARPARSVSDVRAAADRAKAVH